MHNRFCSRRDELFQESVPIHILIAMTSLELEELLNYSCLLIRDFTDVAMCEYIMQNAFTLVQKYISGLSP